MSGGNRQRRFQETLVVLQVALAIVLIAGATLLVRSFVTLQRSTLGFAPEHVVVAQISLPPARFGSDQLQTDYAARLAERLSTMPGVRSAAVASTLPTVGPFSFNAFDVPGRVPKDASDQPVAYAVEAGPGYFATLAIPLIRGRSFANSDHDGSQPVVIIDEMLAKQFYPGVDPVGRQFIITGDTVRREVVGVTAHVREAEPGPDERPTFYLPVAQVPTADMQVLVRVDGDPASFAARIRNVAHDVDPTVPLLEISPMTQRLATTIAPNRFYAVIASVFAGIALLLGAVGLYGILAYTVAQRTREIGIRIALGATPASVRRQIVGYGLALAVIGVFVGSVGAIWLGGVLRGILTAVGTVEPFALFAAAGVFLAVALAGAAIPAARAAKTDPLIAMRAQ